MKWFNLACILSHFVENNQLQVSGWLATLP